MVKLVAVNKEGSVPPLGGADGREEFPGMLEAAHLREYALIRLESRAGTALELAGVRLERDERFHAAGRLARIGIMACDTDELAIRGIQNLPPEPEVVIEPQQTFRLGSRAEVRFRFGDTGRQFIAMRFGELVHIAAVRRS